MGAGAINPFYSAVRSRPMSHFVDESLPIDLLLKAGVTKQGQYDQTQQMLDMLGSFDQNALPGRDTEYVDTVKEDVSKFVESNIGRDLSDNAIARDAFRFATKIRQDKSLKTARENLAAVQQFKEDARELNKKSKLFNPSYYTGLQQIKGYTEGEGQVSDIGDLIVNEALDRRKAREEFFNNASADFHEDFKTMKGLIMKVGVGGIDAKQIQNLAALGFSDYMASKAGQQDVDYYDYLVKTGQTPTDRFGKPITDGSRYVLDQMVRTGLERVHDKSTISFNKGLNEVLGERKKKPGVTTKTQVKPIETDYQAIRELAAKKGGGERSVIAKGIKNKIDQKVDIDPKVIAYREKLKALFSRKDILNPDGSVRAKGITDNDQMLVESFDGALKDQTDQTTAKKVETFLTKNFFNFLEEEAMAGNAKFLNQFSSQTPTDKLGMNVFGTDIYGTNTVQVGSRGISFRGTDRLFTWESMGIDPKSESGKKFIADNRNLKDEDAPPNSGWFGAPDRMLTPSEGGSFKLATAIAGAVNEYRDEKGNVGNREEKFANWKSDALDYIAGLAEDIDDRRNELSKGVSINPQQVWMPLDSKAAKAMSELVGRDNFEANYEVYDPNNPTEVLLPGTDEYTKFKTALQNENNFTTRLGVGGGKFIEVSVNDGDAVTKYQIQELPNTRSEVVQNLYDAYKGEGSYAQASSILGLQNLSQTPTSINNITGFKDLFTSEERATLKDKNLSLRINNLRGYESYSNPITPSVFTYGDNNDMLTAGKVLKDIKSFEGNLTESSANTYARLLTQNLMFSKPRKSSDLPYILPTTDNPEGGTIYKAVYNTLRGTATSKQTSLVSSIKTKPILGYSSVNDTYSLSKLLLQLLKVETE